MPMEGWGKFFSSQNTAGVLQEKVVAVIPQTIKVNGDQDSDLINPENDCRCLFLVKHQQFLWTENFDPTFHQHEGV